MDEAPTSSAVPVPANGEVAFALRGTLVGADLTHLAQALDHVIRARPATVYIDLSATVSWSMVAQAMLLSAQRSLARSGAELILLNPAAALRLQAARMGIFARVRTLDHAPAQSADTAVRTEIAIVAVDRRRALLVRPRDSATFTLPGGTLPAGADPRSVLATYLAAQLGITFDERALEPDAAIPTNAATYARGHTHYFRAPVTARILERSANGTELVWADHDASGIFTATAQHALTELHRTDHID